MNEIKAPTNIYDVFITVFKASMNYRSGGSKEIRDAILDATGAVNSLGNSLSVIDFRDIEP